MDDNLQVDRRRGRVVADAAEVYEEFFVPALFGQFAEPLLDAADVGGGQTVLDVGCGTGIVARRALDRVQPNGRVIGVDPNDGMLAVARRHAPDVTWQHGVAESLPLPDHAVDRTVSQFAAMFFDDPVAALSEMARVTRPGGRVAVATWAQIDTSPGYAALAELLADRVGDWAVDALTAPFSIGSEAAVDDLVRPHGEVVEVVGRPGTARFTSIDDWLYTDVRGWTLADGIDADTYDDLLRAARRRLADFAGPDGTVAFPAPAVFGVFTV